VRAGALRTRALAEAASCRHAAGVRPTIWAISRNGTAKMSCRTNATRSAGVIASSTTSNAVLTESSSVTWSSGSGPISVNAEVGTGSGSQERERQEVAAFSDQGRADRRITVVAHLSSRIPL
jgi:hypothetical protein